MRICSFLPSATEMIAELGFIDSLVGVSEECRWPPEVVGKPVVTAARVAPSSMSSSQIDEAVRASVRDGRSLYMVDAELLEALAPDLIVTQDLCAVCAVSSGELASACRVGVEVLSLDPRTLGEVAESVRVLARRLGVADRGREAAALRALSRVLRHTGTLAHTLARKPVRLRVRASFGWHTAGHTAASGSGPLERCAASQRARLAACVRFGRKPEAVCRRDV